VRCAIEIQRVLEVENDKLETPQRMPFRIGVHLGDVVEKERTASTATA
jgi:class 3 adenylate cyclase